MKFNTVVYLELYKIFRKPRTYIAFGAIAAIVGLIQLCFYADGKNYMQFGMQSFTDSFDINGNIMNGYLMAYIILQLMLVHVPLLISLVAGDMISGEAAQGTLRVLLTKPISRGDAYFRKVYGIFYLHHCPLDLDGYLGLRYLYARFWCR